MMFIQFYVAPKGAILPIQEAWGQIDIQPDALQWDVEQYARGMVDILLGCVGFRVWDRLSSGRVEPISRLVIVKGAAK